MAVSAHPLGPLGLVFNHLSIKPEPASYFSLTSFQLCDSTFLPSVGLTVILVLNVSNKR